MSTLVEVRCCCDATLLLGYVLLDRERVHAGDVLSFPLRPVVSVKPFSEQRDGDLFNFTPRSTLRLQVARASGIDRRSGDYFSGLALKSDDTPIETLRRIQNFREVR